MVRSRRHPLVVGVEEQVDRFQEGLLRELGQGEPARRAAEADRVRVGPERRDAAVRLAEGFEALEHSLGVVED